MGRESAEDITMGTAGFLTGLTCAAVVFDVFKVKSASTAGVIVVKLKSLHG